MPENVVFDEVIMIMRIQVDLLNVGHINSDL